MIPNYPEKLMYLYKHQNHKCDICNRIISFNQSLDLHHKFSNTKWGKKKYPLFINSLLNLSLVHGACHLNKVGRLRITDYNANRYELFLKRHKKISDFVNFN